MASTSRSPPGAAGGPAAVLSSPVPPGFSAELGGAGAAGGGVASPAGAGGAEVTVVGGAAVVVVVDGTDVVVDVQGYYIPPMWAHQGGDLNAEVSRVAGLVDDSQGQFTTIFDRDVSQCGYSVAADGSTSTVRAVRPDGIEPNNVTLETWAVAAMEYATREISRMIRILTN